MATIKRFAIYDMDGTLVDSSHRYRTITENGKTRIDLQHWRDNECRAMQDSLLPLAQQYMEDLKNPNVYVAIATARVMQSPDWEFVYKVLGKPNYFVFRADGDTRSGKELKIKGLQRLFNLIQFKKADAVFYEDNIDYLKAVCDHFNIRGVYIPSVQGH